jgi:protein-disulfide isomerase
VARKPVKPARSMKPFYIGLGVVALAGIALIVWQASGGGGSTATEPVQVAIDPAELSRVQGMSMGRADAPVVIYEFADFQCPGCGQFASFTAPLIKERLVDTGLVRYVYYDYPLPAIHPNAFLASRAGRCANEQERFWDYHDVLYARQPSWSAMGDPTDFFVEMAGELGLDEAAFEDCLRSDRYQEEVSRSLQLGQMMGVGGTPTLFVNMKRIEQQTIPTYADVEGYVREAMGGTLATDSAAPDTAAPSTTP